MSEIFDAIVVGGGHNGLVAAACLAKAGKKVLVLEKRPVLGGLATTEEVFPGYQVNTGADDTSLFLDDIVRDLFLKMHGLEFRETAAALFAPQPDGRALTLWHDEAKSVVEIGRFSQADAARYPAFRQQVNQVAAVLQGMAHLAPPDLFEREVSDLMSWGRMGLSIKRLGQQEMMTFMRILPMPVSDYLDEWFESDALKGALAAYGVTGLAQGPLAAGTAMMFFYQHMGGFPSGRFVRGGMGQLAATLARAAKQEGAQIWTDAPVARVLLDDGMVPSAVGVVLESGEALQARVVLSNLDPRRTLFDLVGPQKLDPGFMRQVRQIIFRGVTAKVNLALRELPHFVGQTDPAQLSGRIRICPSVTYLERAADAAKYGRQATDPFLDCVIPTLQEPGLAPPDRHIMSVTMQYAPYALRQGDWDAEREALGDRVLQTLALYAPGIEDLVLHRQVVTPLDWEREYGLSEGSIHHGQMSLDQLLVMRPVPGWSRYQTPVPNLYLCGAGNHPGGGVTGAPGYNAARAALQAL